MRKTSRRNSRAKNKLILEAQYTEPLAGRIAHFIVNMLASVTLEYRIYKDDEYEFDDIEGEEYLIHFKDQSFLSSWVLDPLSKTDIEELSKDSSKNTYMIDQYVKHKQYAQKSWNRIHREFGRTQKKRLSHLMHGWYKDGAKLRIEVIRKYEYTGAYKGYYAPESNEIVIGYNVPIGFMRLPKSRYTSYRHFKEMHDEIKEILVHELEHVFQRNDLLDSIAAAKQHYAKNNNLPLTMIAQNYGGYREIDSRQFPVIAKVQHAAKAFLSEWFRHNTNFRDINFNEDSDLAKLPEDILNILKLSDQLARFTSPEEVDAYVRNVYTQAKVELRQKHIEKKTIGARVFYTKVKEIFFKSWRAMFERKLSPEIRKVRTGSLINIPTEEELLKDWLHGYNLAYLDIFGEVNKRHFR